ncbi:MAG: helix-turn-helix transcriptional regulator [Betaproteobacteria bacterium]|jgi:prophage regulatory protein|nr:AlpA family transcriptional regulator [Rubrivivax sp.]
MHLVSETRPPVQRDRLLRLPQVEEVTGLKKSTIYRLMREGSFVRAVQVTPRCTAWPESLVLQWVQDRIKAAAAAPAGVQA